MMAGKFEIGEHMSSIKSAVDEAILHMLYPLRERVPEKLYESMVYSLTAGGKRLRPILLISTFSICEEEWEKAIPYAVGVEYIHTYSLIHDDLPSMDDDDFRRGIPTSHKVFGEAMAILTGDALLTEAFRILLEERDDGITCERKMKAANEIAMAAGAAGMVGGQALDLQCSPHVATEMDVKAIHEKKTAALIRASILSGGILSAASEDFLLLFSKFGSKLGLAFQIVDDILDITSSFSEMGKETGKDAEAGKATYPMVLGLQRAEAEAERLISEAKKDISRLGEKAIALGEIANLCLSRRN